MADYKVESVFEYKEYKCVVVFQSNGYRCGYVGVKKDSCIYGKSYLDRLPIKRKHIENKPIGKRGIIPLILESMKDDENISVGIFFDVHGGITYSDKNGIYPIESELYWFGFDCAHYTDAKDYETALKYFENEKATIMRLKELDCKYPTQGEVRTQEYVENECRNLVDQIIELEEILKTQNNKINKIKEQMCDDYCKYPSMTGFDIEDICKDCPLNKLEERSN